jgi:uncharacterized protein (TIGR02001 family)
MKKISISKNIVALACLATLGVSAHAQSAPQPESALSYNVGAVTEYRYRGISQSRFQPAVQAGVDYTDKSGFYVGSWASTIKWISDSGNGASGPVELDLYGGYKFPLGGVTMDVGYLRYQYVNNSLSKAATGSYLYKDANTDELYVAGSYGPFTLKYSYALSNLFGANYTNKGSKGSGYLDLSATFDLGDGYSLVPHAGHQTVENVSIASYTDTALGLAKDMGNGLALTATYYKTNAKASYYSPTVSSDAGKNLGKDTVVLGAKYTF